MDDSHVDRTIKYLVDRNAELETVGQFIDKLEYELGNQGRMYLKTLTKSELDRLFDRFKKRKQEKYPYSPVDSHGYNEIPSGSPISEPMADGPSFLVTDRSHPRHASLAPLFEIEIMPAFPVSREMIRMARNDGQSSHSLIDPRTAAEICGYSEANLHVFPEIYLRWRTYKDGQGIGQLRETRCIIRHIEGANVVFGKDVDGEQKNIESVSENEGEDEVIELAGQLNLATARRLQAEKKKRQNPSHGEPQPKRAKH